MNETDAEGVPFTTLEVHSHSFNCLERKQQWDLTSSLNAYLKKGELQVQPAYTHRSFTEDGARMYSAVAVSNSMQLTEAAPIY